MAMLVMLATPKAMPAPPKIMIATHKAFFLLPLYEIPVPQVRSIAN